jgi:hypothetical protein
MGLSIMRVLISVLLDTIIMTANEQGWHENNYK